MDEAALPSNPVCSAPPLSKPPSPLLSFSSVTLSSADNGQSGKRRSGRIQGIRTRIPKKQDSSDGRADRKPSRQNLSSTKRHLDRVIVVRVPRFQLPRADRTRVPEKQNQNRFEVSLTAEHRHEQKDPESLQCETVLSAGYDVAKPLEEDEMETLDGATPDVETSEVPDVDVLESSSASKGWVIGPLFQSLKSKMASFTEIVMSPVKLFKPSSPPPFTDHLNAVCDADPSEESNMFYSEGLDENNQDNKTNQSLSDVRETQSAETVAPCYLMNLQFDPSSLCSSEGTINQKDSAPQLQNPSACVVSESCESSVLLQTSAKASASQETDLTLSGVDEEQKDQPSTCLARLCGQVGRNEPESKNINSEDKSLQSKLNSGDSRDRSNTQSCCLQADGVESCCSALQSLHNVLIDGTTKTSPKPFLDAQQMETQPNSEMCSVSGVVRPKRALKLSCHFQDSAKRKKPTADKNQPPSHVAWHSDAIKGARTSRRGAALMNVAHEEETAKLDKKRPVMLEKAEGKGKNGEAAAIISQTESSSEAVSICLLDNPKSSQAKIRTLIKHDVNNDNRMDVETALPMTSTKQTEEKQLSVGLVRPDRKRLQSAGRGIGSNKKPVKRKTLHRLSPAASTSSVEHLEPIKGLCSSSLTTGLSQPSKRSTNRCRSAAKFLESSQTPEAEQRISSFHSNTEEEQSGKMDPVHFESSPKPVQSHPQLNLDCYVQLNKDVLITDEIFLTYSESRACPLSGPVGRRTRAENHRSRCRVSRAHRREEGSKPVTVEEADLASSLASKTSFSTCLLRSNSCPEIPSLCPRDSAWTSPHSTHHSRTPALNRHSHFVPRKSVRRARRHTVCSVEVEREIAPLCLRKEVYPSARSVPAALHRSPAHAHSPSSSLSALASCFLSSPLAFLSKKSSSRGAAASSTASCHVSSSSVSSSSSSSTWQPSSFMPTTDSAAPLGSCSSEDPSACEAERRRRCEEEDYGEDTSSSSQEFEDVRLREEKAAAGFETKIGKKREERGKVSSIKIRRALPKPQANLTPMGLPKPIRLKKKEFSVEEIYTNKNFNKPPESRLETIFEVPLNRKNGSESWCGPRRKRFLEFLEAGTVRKLKKPLVGAGKAGVSSSRTRRSGAPKDEPSLSVQDVDSLLCAKLDELSLWLIHDQRDG